MDLASFKKLEKILGINFKNTNLLIRALTHKSISKVSETNNERLEFIGDRVLNLVIANKLSHLYPNDAEGVLDKKLASLVNKNVCSKIVSDLNIDKYLIVSGSQKKNRAGHKKIFGDLCESIIGAVFIDQGFKVSSNFVLKLWKKNIENSVNIDVDAKTKLQEYSLKKFKKLPMYKTVSYEGPAHRPIFKVSVKLEDNKIYVGTGSSKKIAEQAAAEQLLKNLVQE
jgi:ribonuclease-3